MALRAVDHAAGPILKADFFAGGETARLENFTVHRYLIAMELPGSNPDFGRGAAEIATASVKFSNLEHAKWALCGRAPHLGATGAAGAFGVRWHAACSPRFIAFESKE